MAKGIIVVDIPEKRKECPLYDYEDGYCAGKCGNKKYDHRYCLGVDTCCPIKPMPKEWTKEYKDDYGQGFAAGWNAYRSRILGE